MIMLQLEQKMKDQKKKFNILKPLIIFFVWVFPFVIGAIPFLMFFNPDRTEWLKANGYKGIDWNEDAHSTLNIILVIIFLTQLLSSVAYYVYRLRKNEQEDKELELKSKEVKINDE